MSRIPSNEMPARPKSKSSVRRPNSALRAPKSALKRRAMLDAIKRAYGSLKRKPGDKTFVEEWAEHVRAEKELEDRLDRQMQQRIRPTR